MRKAVLLSLLIPALLSTSSVFSQIKKVKVKAFIDEKGVDHSPYVFNSVSESDAGTIVAVYPDIGSQPDWIKEKKGYTTPVAVHTWSRDKAIRQVKTEPYLVYGRDKAEAMGVIRLGSKTYMIAYQDKSAGGSAVVYSRLSGSGITPSPCNQLVEGNLTMNLKERPSNIPARGLYNGVYSHVSRSGEHGLISLLGDITMEGQKADVAMVCVNKEMSVQWTEAFQLTEAGKTAEVLDIAMLGEQDAVILVRVTMGKEHELRLYRRSAKDFLVIDLEGDVIQDAEIMISGDVINIAGLFGHAEDKKDRSFGGFHLTVNSEDLSIGTFNDDKFSDPKENTVLAGVDFTEDGKCYVTAASYIYEGTKAGAGGTELKNIKYHCSDVNIFHFNSDGSHARTTYFPMANTGRSAMEVIPVTTEFDGDLVIFYNEDPDNKEKRKKEGPIDASDAAEDKGAQYTQFNFKGESYSRMFMKEDDEVRSLFPLRTWKLGKGEIFMMGVVNTKNPVFYPIKIDIKPGTS